MPQLEYGGKDGNWNLVKHEIDNTTLGLKEAKVRFFLRVDNWKSACIQKGGYSQLTLAIKDPTGVSQKLTEYQKLVSFGNLKAFEVRDCLNEVIQIVKKLIETNERKRTEFAKFLKEFSSTVTAAKELAGKRLFNDLMARKAGNLAAQQFRDFCANVEFSPEAYDGPIEFQEAIDEIKRSPNSWYLEHLRLIETFKIREKQEDCVLNLGDTEREQWVNAVENNEAQRADKLLNHLREQLVGSCLGEQFSRYWQKK